MLPVIIYLFVFLSTYLYKLIFNIIVYNKYVITINFAFVYYDNNILLVIILLWSKPT